MRKTPAVDTNTFTAAGLALAVSALLIAGPAEARRLVKPYYSETYDTRGPARGYEGFLFPDYYCSYKRFPNRVCSTNSRGKESCRIKGWRLEQTCQ